MKVPPVRSVLGRRHSGDSNHCVRQVADRKLVHASGIVKDLNQVDGEVTTLVGAGKTRGFADGQRTSAFFNHLIRLALGIDGHLIVANTVNDRIRKVTIAEGRVTTVAGSAAVLYNSPEGVAVDSNNNILVARHEQPLHPDDCGC